MLQGIFFICIFLIQFIVYSMCITTVATSISLLAFGLTHNKFFFCKMQYDYYDVKSHST